MTGTTPMGTTPMDEDYGTVICTSCGATVSIERLVIGVSDVTLSCPYCGRTAPAAEPETAGAYR